MYAVFHLGESVSCHVWHEFARALLYFCNKILCEYPSLQRQT